jgi:hypothetical protein
MVLQTWLLSPAHTVGTTQHRAKYYVYIYGAAVDGMSCRRSEPVPHMSAHRL